MNNGSMVREMEILERTLWEATEDTYATWLRDRYLQTLAQSIRTAVTSIIQEISEDDLEVDVLALEDGAAIYVTETAPRRPWAY